MRRTGQSAEQRSTLTTASPGTTSAGRCLPTPVYTGFPLMNVRVSLLGSGSFSESILIKSAFVPPGQEGPLLVVRLHVGGKVHSGGKALEDTCEYPERSRGRLPGTSRLESMFTRSTSVEGHVLSTSFLPKSDRQQNSELKIIARNRSNTTFPNCVMVLH